MGYSVDIATENGYYFHLSIIQLNGGFNHLVRWFSKKTYLHEEFPWIKWILPRTCRFNHVLPRTCWNLRQDMWISPGTCGGLEAQLEISGMWILKNYDFSAQNIAIELPTLCWDFVRFDHWGFCDLLKGQQDPKPKIYVGIFPEIEVKNRPTNW